MTVAETGRFDSLSTGIYSVPEAARLSGVPAARIRRWLRGYAHGPRKSRRRSAPVWTGQIEPRDGALALGFRDLLEVRFVDAFLRAGVSWQTMRLAHTEATRELSTDHPFCSNRFVTDGRRILLRQAQGTLVRGES